MIKVYGIPTCDKIKKTLALMNNKKVSYEFINVRKSPLSETGLKKIISHLGMEKVLNRQGMLYKKLGLKDKDLSGDQLFGELLKEQGMIKRPLIEKDGRFYCGFNEPEILNFIK